ncbi:E3 ubiquitin-protein ligase Topors-like [Anas platyrhynchos]|uniref:E3 ubiquitin-protein ligase Topors-like n=1 Tax=Anas platyrhynchos TaxID=8839 RepID=UPI0018D905BB|nr:E3 ubiquitin-protein ligase Topors-like [Anas platyrhynchos]
MASAPDKRCPICLDMWSNAGYVLPCLHRFCFKCIQRWAERKPECPLCKGRVTSIVHSVQADDNFEEVTIRPPVGASFFISRERRPTQLSSLRSPRRPVTSQLLSVGLVSSAPLGGIHPFLWASLFREYPALLQPLLPWLDRELHHLLRAENCQAEVVEDLILSSLRTFGLQEDALVPWLQFYLKNHTVMFVHQLIKFIVRHCFREARRLLSLDNFHAAMGLEDSPETSPGLSVSLGESSTPALFSSGSPARANVEGLPSSSTAAPHGGLSHPSSVCFPICGDEVPQEEPGEAVAGPSAGQQGRGHARRGGRQAPRRRASASPNSLAP